ncbi:hypothetical protein [Chitinophaga arvensicola]|uniref:Uncharacterized protein n=1 Tax=Chitinophaga arvensicola TaxID=29529 RepID=A0A1I0QJR1_9BACT|nr:hypothetical protein [Chitinophaga arvensicola]SEW27209.1 hypothetical protein SAMN04488122_1513 [Chitinophaga arvensicola]
MAEENNKTKNPSDEKATSSKLIKLSDAQLEYREMLKKEAKARHGSGIRIINNQDNMLWVAHNHLTNLPIRLRDAIINDCGLSLPTYYRYMRPSTKLEKGVETRVPHTLTIAEKYMIKKNFDVLFKEMVKFHSDFMKLT